MKRPRHQLPGAGALRRLALLGAHDAGADVEGVLLRARRWRGRAAREDHLVLLRGHVVLHVRLLAVRVDGEGLGRDARRVRAVGLVVDLLHGHRSSGVRRVVVAVGPEAEQQGGDHGEEHRGHDARPTHDRRVLRRRGPGGRRGGGLGRVRAGPRDLLGSVGPSVGECLQLVLRRRIVHHRLRDGLGLVGRRGIANGRCDGLEGRVALHGGERGVDRRGLRRAAVGLGGLGLDRLLVLLRRFRRVAFRLRGLRGRVPGVGVRALRLADDDPLAAPPAAGHGLAAESHQGSALSREVLEALLEVCLEAAVGRRCVVSIVGHQSSPCKRFVFTRRANANGNEKT